MPENVVFQVQEGRLKIFNRELFGIQETQLFTAKDYLRMSTDYSRMSWKDNTAPNMTELSSALRFSFWKCK